jgi:allophanate hydrolase subunit 1
MTETIQIALDAEDLAAVKRIARKKRTDVVAMVEAYLRSLVKADTKQYVSEQLTGCLQSLGNRSDAELRADYLKEKHGA